MRDDSAPPVLLVSLSRIKRVLQHGLTDGFAGSPQITKVRPLFLPCRLRLRVHGAPFPWSSPDPGNNRLPCRSRRGRAIDSLP